MPKKLLLADDSVTIQKVVGISFANEDIELVTVDNGDDAVTKAREVRPDVVLADVVMPGLNGYEVCEALKGDPATAGVPVLLLTGTFEAFDDERASACGAAGHIAKPFEAQALVDRVRDLLAAPPAVEAAPIPAASDDGTTIAIGKIDLESTDSAALAASADSFDFFDESVQANAAPTPEVQLDPQDDSFAFAADAGPAGAVPAPPATPVPEALDEAPMAGTLLMDDGPHVAEPMAPSEDTLARLVSGVDDDLAAGPMAPSEETLARLVSDGTESSDIFDFANEGPEASAPAFAQETVLDPQGSSGYDVSSADLNGLTEVVPEASGDGDNLLWSESSEPMTPVGGPSADPAADLPPLADLPPVPEEGPSTGDTLDTPAMATVLEEASLDEVGFAEPAWADHASDAGEMPLVAPARRAEDDDRVAPTHDPAAAAGVALAEIEPQLRASIHDTLEKIAWESLGHVAEQVIEQAVERIEKAAWEVIPQLAETMIREEIRRLKGES